MIPRSLLVGAALGAVLAAALLIAGPLNPPAGPVASSYKTLSEVEPRIAISAATTPGDADSLFRITQPGSYYLTGNITGESGKRGIKITTSNVTIDLNGFSLDGVPGSLSGVFGNLAVAYTLTVRNGSIRGWGGSGIEAAANAVRIENITTSFNSAVAIIAGPYSVIRNCTAYEDDGGGIQAASRSNVSNCVVRCGGTTPTQVGISVGDSSVVTSCTVTSSETHGIRATTRCLVLDCSVSASVQDGIRIDGDASQITRCNASGNVGAGIATVGSGSSILDCTISGNGAVGISAGAQTSISRCTIIGGTGQNAPGITVGDGSSITECTVNNCTGRGIQANNGCHIAGNLTRNNQADGIYVNFSCSVVNNTGNGDGSAIGTHAAIRVIGQANRIEGNTISYADRGVLVEAPGNTIIRNSAKGCAVNFDIIAGNDTGPIGSAATAASPWANIQF